jgi:HEAT repeat protein
MEDPDPWLRMHVIEQLAAIGDRRVPMFVNRFLDDEDEMVREVAMAILQGRPEAMGSGEPVQ